MAERRMMTKKVTDDDHFMSLSSSAQALYLHLTMSADDDGFCNQVSISMFKAHASVSDLEQLLEKRYIYQFENGVIVIKHWRMANALRKDRYTETTFKEELAQLQIEDNGSYAMSKCGRLPSGCQVAATGKDSIGKDSIGYIEDKPTRHKYGKYSNIMLTDEDLAKWKEECNDWSTYIEKMSEYCASSGKTYKNYLAALRNWYRKDGDKPKDPAPSYNIEQFKNESIHKTLKYERKKNNE